MRNSHLDQLTSPYLFGAVNEQARSHPNPVNLGVGDTTLPLADCVIETLKREAHNALRYGPEHGDPRLRQRIAECFYPMLSGDEIFIADGIKTDIGRIQTLFASDIQVAIEDPTYPSYREAAMISGKTKISTFSHPTIPHADLIIVCSPNNPTGGALSRKELTTLIEAAHQQGSIILYDAAYASFIADPDIPRTPYEIAGADQVVIELGSFSKLAGFTGLRLSWSVVPKALKNRLHADWSRIISVYYNGTSKLIQAAGLAALSPDGLKAIEQQMVTYHRRAKRLREGLTPYFPTIHGGIHAPYLWIPGSTKPFAQLGIITIPGEGFGLAGKGYVRLSAFGTDETIEEAIKRCSQLNTHLSI